MTPTLAKAIYLACLLFGFFALWTFHLVSKVHFIWKWLLWAAFIAIALFAGLAAFDVVDSADGRTLLALAFYGMFAATFITARGPVGFIQKLLRRSAKEGEDQSS